MAAKTALGKQIDKSARKTVDAFNSIDGVWTTASCQGHLLRWSAPYVAFHSPVDFAATLERSLRNRTVADGGEHTLAAWTVQGVFNEDFQLVFRLFCPEYRHAPFFRKRRIILGDWKILPMIVGQAGRIWMGRE